MDGNECCTSSPITRQKFFDATTKIDIYLYSSLPSFPSWIYRMSDNRKQEKYFTKEGDARLPEAAEIIKVCVYTRPSI